MWGLVEVSGFKVSGFEVLSFVLDLDLFGDLLGSRGVTEELGKCLSRATLRVEVRCTYITYLVTVVKIELYVVYL